MTSTNILHYFDTISFIRIGTTEKKKKKGTTVFEHVICELKAILGYASLFQMFLNMFPAGPKYFDLEGGYSH